MLKNENQGPLRLCVTFDNYLMHTDRGYRQHVNEAARREFWSQLGEALDYDTLYTVRITRDIQDHYDPAAFFRCHNKALILQADVRPVEVKAHIVAGVDWASPFPGTPPPKLGRRIARAFRYILKGA